MKIKKYSEFVSDARFLGLPVVHVVTGGIDEEGNYCRGVAKGWIAVGDVATGILFAVGGVALSLGISFGGLSLGLLMAFGGMAVGCLSLGGMAVGVIALGGGAFGLYAIGGGAVAIKAAMGGGAVAGQFAVGGDASAEHANDAVACAFFAEHWFFSKILSIMDFPAFDYICKRF